MKTKWTGLKELGEPKEKIAKVEALRLTMDPTSVLPEEVAEFIFKLLSIEDILSCCLVSSSWRKAINSNIVWKRLCRFKINIKSFVGPTFQIPPREHLSPICENRLKYMQEIHVLNNFKNNRCVDQQIPEQNAMYVKEVEFINNYRYILTNYNDQALYSFKVWDIENVTSPSLVQTVPHLLQLPTNTFEVLDDCLFITQANIFQIYTVVDGMLSLKLCRIFDMEESVSQSIPPSSSIQSWYTTNFGVTCCFSSTIQVVQKYFIGTSCRLLRGKCVNIQFMHIWDWNCGKKLKIERFPDKLHSNDVVALQKYSKYLYIALSFEPYSDVRYKIYSYDLKLLRYTHFYTVSNTVDIINFMVCDERRVVVFTCDIMDHCKKYILVDAMTGKTIVQKELDYPIHPCVTDYYATFMAFASNKTVIIVDTCTQTEVAVLKVNFEANGVLILNPNLLLVEGSDTSNFIEVWDIKKKSKFYRLENKSVSVCASFFRLIVKINNSLHVLNY